MPYKGEDRVSEDSNVTVDELLNLYKDYPDMLDKAIELNRNNQETVNDEESEPSEAMDQVMTRAEAEREDIHLYTSCNVVITAENIAETHMSRLRNHMRSVDVSTISGTHGRGTIFSGIVIPGIINGTFKSERDRWDTLVKPDEDGRAITVAINTVNMTSYGYNPLMYLYSAKVKGLHMHLIHSSQDNNHHMVYELNDGYVAGLYSEFENGNRNMLYRRAEQIEEFNIFHLSASGYVLTYSLLFQDLVSTAVF
jgi:hypothetical protein